MADGPVEEEGRRCCINSAALRFVPYEGQGYGAYRKLLNNKPQRARERSDE